MEMVHWRSPVYRKAAPRPAQRSRPVGPGSPGHQPAGPRPPELRSCWTRVSRDTVTKTRASRGPLKVPPVPEGPGTPGSSGRPRA